jgi:Papain-like cysteine protease AvrRpt2
LEIKIAHRVELLAAGGFESCWAAAAAMLYGGGRPAGARQTAPDSPSHGDAGATAVVTTPVHVAAGTLAHFARQWELTLLRPREWTPDGLSKLLERRPLWLGAYRPNGHAMVLAGMLGDGTAGGTHLTVLDPLPRDRGAVHCLPFSVWAARYSLASMHVLHRPIRERAADPLAALKSLVGEDWESQ